MTTRMLMLVLLIGSLSTSVWAQGPTCTQYHSWTLSGGAGCGTYPSATWVQAMEGLQAQVGGAGPHCTYTPNPYYAGCWYGECYSTAWTCKPPSPPVGGCSGCTGGEPISLDNGNVYIQQTDVWIPGLGGGLMLARTWNSTWIFGLPQEGRFGAQWSSTYTDEQLYPGSDGTMKYARADGSTWSFASYGSPATFHLIAPANSQAATLTEQGTTSPTWTVTFQNGEQRVFNGLYGGPLAAIIDRNGNTTTLTYETVTSGSLTSSRPATVTDPAGRHLNFTYSPDNTYLVTGVTLDSGSGVNVTYTYKMGYELGMASFMQSYPFLVQVTQADNTFVTFTYNTEGMITSVNDSNGKVLESHNYGIGGCNAGLSSSRANGVDALTINFPNLQWYCGFAGVGALP